MACRVNKRALEVTRNQKAIAILTEDLRNSKIATLARAKGKELFHSDEYDEVMKEELYKIVASKVEKFGSKEEKERLNAVEWQEEMKAELFKGIIELKEASKGKPRNKMKIEMTTQISRKTRKKSYLAQLHY